MHFPAKHTVGIGLFVCTFAAVNACGSDDDECETNDDCAEGQVCTFNQCLASSGDGGLPINNNNNGGMGPILNVNNNNLNGNEPDDGVDDTPPTIVIREPEPYLPRTGNVLIVVDVIDLESGVEPTSVFAVLADTEVVPLVAGSDTGITNATFSGVWDSSPYAGSLAPSLEIVASDTAGNEAAVGNTILLDYAGPSVDMNPVDVRPAYDSIAGSRCGARFPMLGPLAVLPGEVISPSGRLGLAFFPRAEIIDQLSEGAYGVSPLAAGVDEDASFFAFIDQAGIAANARLVSSDRADGRCNIVNPDLIKPATSTAAEPEAAIVQQLFRTVVTGFPDFSVETLDLVEPGTRLSTLPDGCSAWGASPDDPAPEPTRICEAVSRDLYAWIPGSFTRVGVPLSRVFVANAYDDQSTDICAGGFFDSFNLVADGPACITVQSADELGNTSVALPLYICIDKDGSGDCDGFAPTVEDVLTNCTDGCITNDIVDGVEFSLDPSNPAVDLPEVVRF